MRVPQHLVYVEAPFRGPTRPYALHRGYGVDEHSIHIEQQSLCGYSRHPSMLEQISQNHFMAWLHLGVAFLTEKPRRLGSLRSSSWEIYSSGTNVMPGESPLLRGKKEAQERIDALCPRVLIVAAARHAQILHIGALAPPTPLQQAMQLIAFADHRRPLGEPDIQPDARSRLRARAPHIWQHAATRPPYRGRQHRQPSEDLRPGETAIQRHQAAQR